MRKRNRRPKYAAALTAALRERPVFAREAIQLPSDLVLRAATIAPATLSTSERVVQATVATDSPVPVYDPFTYEIIDEVLLSRGVEADSTVPLLRDHDRYQVTSILGAVERITASDNTVDAWLRFGRDLDPSAEAIYRRVEQGFLRKVSAGYAYLREDTIEIPAGGSATVNGRTFRAGTRMMRIVKKWRLREVSMVVIPADELSQLRSHANANSQNSGGPIATGTESLQSSTTDTRANSTADTGTYPSEPSMHPVLQFLRSLGLQVNASIEQTRAFCLAITDTQRAQLSQLVTQHGIPAEFPADMFRSASAAPAAGAALINQTTSTGTQGAQAPAIPSSQQPAATSTPDASGMRSSATQTVPVTTNPAVDPIQQERQRAQTIRLLAGDDIPGALVGRALDEGWSIEQAGIQFAQSRNQARPDPLAADTHGQAPFGHVRQGGVTIQALQAGLMMREGVQLDNPVFAGMGAQAMFGRESSGARWFAEANRALTQTQRLPDDASRAFDAAYTMRHWSMVDYGRAIATLAGIRAPDDPYELFERVNSTLLWTNLFTTSMNALILATYETTPDPTDSFVRRVDVNNFLTNERIQLGKAAGMAKEGVNGGEGQHMNSTDRKETYKLERFIGQMEYDDKAFVNDQFNTIDQYTVSEMGSMARQLPADLVFGILLGNPTMGDGTALFHANHGNLTAAAPLSSANLGVAWTKMGTQTENGRPLQLFAQNLITSIANNWLAEQLVGSQRNTGGSTTVPELNPAFGRFRAIGDSRVDNGVIDHAGNGSLIAGAPTTYFLAATGGRHTIEVGYLRGTGRAPRIMTKELPGARIGKLYMVYLDAMAKALDWRGLARIDAT